MMLNASLSLLLLVLLTLPPIAFGDALVEIFNNTALGGEPIATFTSPTISSFFQTDDDHHDTVLLLEPWQSVRIQAMLEPPAQEWYLFSFMSDAGYVRLHVDHHLLMDQWVTGEAPPSSSPKKKYNSTNITTNTTVVSSFYAVQVPQLGTSSLVQLELTFWDKVPSQRMNFLANDTFLPESWYKSDLIPKAELEYQKYRREAEVGWNTWLSRDMLSHVCLPSGLTISIELTVGNFTVSNIASPSCDTKEFPLIHGIHDTRGEYTEIQELTVGDAKFRVESTASNDILVIVISALTTKNTIVPTTTNAMEEATATIRVGAPHDYIPRYCKVAKTMTNDDDDGESIANQSLVAVCPGFDTVVVSGKNHVEPLMTAQSNDRAAVMRLPIKRNEKISFSARKTTSALLNQQQSSSPPSLETSIQMVRKARWRLLRRIESSSPSKHTESMIGLLTAISWNVIYTPYEGIITPVFRGSPWWLSKPHDYVLFEWDTYFASIMASFLDDWWVAINNLVRMTYTIFGGDGSYAVNFWNGKCGSMDRSEPPIAGLALKVLIEHSQQQQWVAELLLDPLIEWNKWWVRERMQMRRRDGIGLIAPGSTRANANLTMTCDVKDPPLIALARFETGLDNSPMYDSATFIEKGQNVMDQVDVGMSSLYAFDAWCLVQVAKNTRGRRLYDDDDVSKLDIYAEQTMMNIKQDLWNEQEGIFLNKQWTTGEWVSKDDNGVYPIAPTSFYPLLFGNENVTDSETVDRLIQRYLSNSSEFAVNAETTFGMPSISRSSAAFKDMQYWRGRTWGPMNFLVYLGLLQYPNSTLARKARRDLAAQSEATFLVEWLARHRVMENFNSLTGTGCGSQANPFYHWGALNALIPLMEAGAFDKQKVVDMDWKSHASFANST